MGELKTRAVVGWSVATFLLALLSIANWINHGWSSGASTVFLALAAALQIFAVMRLQP